MTAATVHSNIRAAIRQRLLTIPGLPAQAWEGREFTPVRGTAYLSESFRPLASDVRALGLGGTIAHSINASITLHFPANGGTNPVDAIAGAILAAFRPGTSLVYGGDSGVVQQATRAGLVQEPDWLNCAVTISVVAYTSN